MDNTQDNERRKEIDKDISSYLSVRRKKEKTGIMGFAKSFSRKSRKEEARMHPEVETYGGEAPKKSKGQQEQEEKSMETDFEEGSKKKTLWGWLKGKAASSNEEQADDSEKEVVIEEATGKQHAPTPEDYEIEDDYEDESSKEGLFSRIFGKVFAKTGAEEELEDANDEISEDIQDIKEIAEISTKVMKMLDPEKLKEFKHSPDFEKFKEILKKRQLIR